MSKRSKYGFFDAMLEILNEHRRMPTVSDGDLATLLFDAVLDSQQRCPTCAQDEEDRLHNASLRIFAYLNTVGRHLGVGGPEDGAYADLKVGSDKWWSAVFAQLRQLVPDQSSEARQ